METPISICSSTSPWARRPAIKLRAPYLAARSSRMDTANTPRKSTSALAAFDGDYTIRVSHDLHQSQQTGDSLDTGNDHPRRDRRRTEKDGRTSAPTSRTSPIVVHLSGGRRKKVLPYVDPDGRADEGRIRDAKKSQAAGRSRHRGGSGGRQEARAAANPAGASKPAVRRPGIESSTRLSGQCHCGCPRRSWL